MLSTSSIFEYHLSKVNWSNRHGNFPLLTSSWLSYNTPLFQSLFDVFCPLNFSSGAATKGRYYTTCSGSALAAADHVDLSFCIVKTSTPDSKSAIGTKNCFCSLSGICSLTLHN